MDHSCYFWCMFVMLSRASVYTCLVVTCWERTDLLALVCDVLLRFFYFPIGLLSQVWFLIVSISDLCPLSYFTSCPFKFAIISLFVFPSIGFPSFCKLLRFLLNNLCGVRLILIKFAPHLYH